MLFIVIFGLLFLLFVLGMTYLFSHFLFLIPIWIILGYLFSMIFIVLIGIVSVYTWFRWTKVDNKIKGYVTRSICKAINFWALGVVTKIIGKENIPKNGKLVIVGNHKSVLDPLFLVESIQRPVAFSPKKSLYKVHLLKILFNALGYMQIDRQNNKAAAREMVKTINQVKKGYAFMTFPEGGIIDGETEEMVSLRAGIYKVALKSEADILPVVILGTHKVIKGIPFLTRKVVIKYLDILKYESFKDKSTQEIGMLVMESINQEVRKSSY